MSVQPEVSAWSLLHQNNGDKVLGVYHCGKGLGCALLMVQIDH